MILFFENKKREQFRIFISTQNIIALSHLFNELGKIKPKFIHPYEFKAEGIMTVDLTFNDSVIGQLTFKNP